MEMEVSYHTDKKRRLNKVTPKSWTKNLTIVGAVQFPLIGLKYKNRLLTCN